MGKDHRELGSGAFPANETERQTDLDDILTVPVPGGAVRLARAVPSDQIAEHAAAHGWSSFEAPLPAHLVRAVRTRPGLLVDVGANTGVFSLIAARAAPRLRVLAVEPLPSVRAALARNLALNDVGDRITIVAEALGDHVGRAPLYIPPDDHGFVETSASLQLGFKPVHARVEQVRVTTLDRLMRRPSLLFRRVGVIKIDVEGHEAAVLAGARRVMARDRPLVFCEILPSADLERIRAVLARLDYRAILLRPDGPTDEGLDLRFHDDLWNHLFAPAEQAASVTAPL